jgi:cytidine deaminase
VNERELEALVSEARAASEKAYAPYSKFHVGAALKTPSGRTFTGTNVESASYGATICAERSAVSAMVAAGERAISAVAVFVDAPEPATPCGICRQVLVEFTDDATIVCATPSGRIVTSIAELLPRAFKLRP